MTDDKLKELEAIEAEMEDEKEGLEPLPPYLRQTNRHMRRAMYAPVSRSKPYAKSRNPKLKAERVANGRRKITEVLQRGFNHNQTVVYVKKDKVSNAVNKALKGAK